MVGQEVLSRATNQPTPLASNHGGSQPTQEAPAAGVHSHYLAHFVLANAKVVAGSSQPAAKRKVVTPQRKF